MTLAIDLIGKLGQRFALLYVPHTQLAIMAGGYQYVRVFRM